MMWVKGVKMHVITVCWKVAGQIHYNYMIIICIVHISDNVMDTGVFPLGSKYIEAETFFG
jgi:hypothetical protein